MITNANRLTNLFLTGMWLLMLPIAYYFGWIYSVVFISIVSIYANFASHWAAWRSDADPNTERLDEILAILRRIEERE